jgi:aryl-alcohol dehydrogenase-like predicted oxidoreductase
MDRINRRQFLGSLAGAVATAAHARTSFGAPPDETRPASRTIPKRLLGRTGVEVTVLALGGVVGMLRKPSADFHPAELANAALDMGITYFDTAPAYGNGQSELNYGEVLARRRKEVFLASKTGQRSYDGAMREVEASLKRLRTDRLDLLQIHGARAGEDVSRWGKPDGVVTALQKLRDQKVTRFIGVTGHESADIMRRAIETYDFDTILTTFNPTAKRRPYEELVLPVARKKRMGILAMKVMGGGVGSLALGNPIKNDGASNHDEALRQAKPTALIRYVLGLPITCAVVGMGSITELKTNIQAARDVAPFDGHQRETLRKEMSGT